MMMYAHLAVYCLGVRRLSLPSQKTHPYGHPQSATPPLRAVRPRVIKRIIFNPQIFHPATDAAAPSTIINHIRHGHVCPIHPPTPAAAVEPGQFAWLAYLMSTERESCHSNIYVGLALAPPGVRMAAERVRSHRVEYFKCIYDNATEPGGVASAR